jgi:hypothetical protein
MTNAMLIILYRPSKNLSTHTIYNNRKLPKEVRNCLSALVK